MENTPIVRMVNIVKNFGHVEALKGVSLELRPKEILGLLGDNGAGKSTLIKILSGVYPPTKGEIYFEGKQVYFTSPRDAVKMGIETVHQQLSLVPVMNIWRNFFLGRELTTGKGIFKVLERGKLREATKRIVKDIGVSLRSVDEAVAVLSGGERQAISIGRAMYFGAKVLILDEPMNALSIREQRFVRDFISRARDQGASIIFITHNVHHVYPSADRFVILNKGVKIADIEKKGITPEDVAEIIARGEPFTR